MSSAGQKRPKGHLTDSVTRILAVPSCPVQTGKTVNYICKSPLGPKGPSGGKPEQGRQSRGKSCSMEDRVSVISLLVLD